jgi:festuclavine dehydrogenase
MTILITGGTGKTGSQLARLLDTAKIPVLIASRSGSAPAPFEGVKFDWFDESTYQNAFDARSDIDKVYLVLPSVFDPKPIAKSFIDFAISKGVKRFVLLSASGFEKGSDGNGKAHEYLAESGADYVVLRPTWFIGADAISLLILISS